MVMSQVDRDYSRLIARGEDLGRALECGKLNSTLDEDSIFYDRSRCRGNKLDAGPDSYVNELGQETVEYK